MRGFESLTLYQIRKVIMAYFDPLDIIDSYTAMRPDGLEFIGGVHLKDDEWYSSVLLDDGRSMCVGDMWFSEEKTFSKKNNFVIAAVIKKKGSGTKGIIYGAVMRPHGGMVSTWRTLDDYDGRSDCWEQYDKDVISKNGLDKILVRIKLGVESTNPQPTIEIKKEIIMSRLGTIISKPTILCGRNIKDYSKDELLETIGDLNGRKKDLEDLNISDNSSAIQKQLKNLDSGIALAIKTLDAK
jgi:hypothetical protein